VLVDQWRLPDELLEVSCADASDVCRAMTDQVVRGAPVLGQVAAYGLALTVRRARDLTVAERQAVVEAAAAALRAVRPSARPIAYAVERMLARWEIAHLRLDLDETADAMRAEADAIASEAQYDHAKLARRAAASIVTPDDRPIGVLVHGNAGGLAGGHIGTALGVVQRLVADGRPVHVWATESRPSLEGARLTTLELRRMGAPFTLVADAVAGWVLANQPIDAVLVGAETIAANGDTANTVGTHAIAALAAACQIPVLVCAPSSTIAVDVAGGAAVPDDLDAQGAPMNDITPATLITAVFTEEGRASPSAAGQVIAAYERGARRRLPHGGSAETTAVAG
jgi:methylthioribose-1-phosphate isomerase